MIWIYSLSWQEWIIGALFLLFSSIYLYKLNAITAHLKTYPHVRVYLKFILRSLVVLCAIAALLGPSFGYIKKEQIVQTRNWLVYIDASLSMAAQDVLPSRLDEAKKLLTELSQQHPNDLFSLSAFGPGLHSLCPLTSDRDAYKLFLNQLSVNTFEHPGSNGERSFQEIYNELYLRSKNDKNPLHSSIVLIISDGEFHTPPSEASLASMKKLPFHYVFVGTGSNLPCPIPMGKTELTDNAGRKVLTKLDRDQLRQLALNLRGTYFDSHEYNLLTKHVSGLPGLHQKIEHTQTSINKYFYFLVLSVLFIVMDILITVKTMTI